MSNWKAGDKALCVDGSPTEWDIVGGHVERGVIYLVLHVGPAGLAVSGCATHVYDGREGHWGFWRFRKIVPACDRVAMEQEQEAAK